MDKVRVGAAVVLQRLRDVSPPAHQVTGEDLQVSSGEPERVGALRCDVFPLLFFAVFGAVSGNQAEDEGAALYEAIVHRGDDAAADSTMFARLPVLRRCVWAAAAFDLTFAQKVLVAVAVSSSRVRCRFFACSMRAS